MCDVRFLLPQRPTRPLPIQTNTRRSVLGPVPAGQLPFMTPGQRSTLPLSEAQEMRAGEPARRHGVDSVCRALKRSCQDAPLITKSTARRPGLFSSDVPWPARKTLAQAQAKHRPVASRSHPQTVVGKCGQNSSSAPRPWVKSLPRSLSRLARTLQREQDPASSKPPSCLLTQCTSLGSRYPK